VGRIQNSVPHVQVECHRRQKILRHHGLGYESVGTSGEDPAAGYGRGRDEYYGEAQQGIVLPNAADSLEASEARCWRRDDD